MGRGRLIGLGLGGLGLGLGGLGTLAVVGERAPAQPTPSTTAPELGRACPRAAPDHATRCRRCHAEIHDEWRSSGHASAFVDPVFRAEYDPAPSPFCADCHAAARARHGHPAPDGVDCASCHPTPAAAPPADTPAAPWKTCAPCHQFDFPAAELGTHGVYDPADPLQDTVHEWSRSDAAREGRDCLDCHMPWMGEGTARHRSHRLVGAGDAALVASAVEASARARVLPDALEITVTLAPGDVGHRVPTGDMFRQLRVAAWHDQAPAVEQWLGRRFAHMPASDDRGFRLRPVLDDRIPAPGDGEPLEVRLRLPGAGLRQAQWSVELHRMPPAQARARGLPPDQLRTPVAAGTVIADTDRPPG